MTPEERLRRLREPEQWNFRLNKRADAVPARARWSPFAVSLATIATVAVVGVLVFSVFGLGIQKIGETAGLLPATSTPAPVQLNCSTLLSAETTAVLTDKGLEDVSSTFMPDLAAHPDRFDQKFLTFAGGVVCAWAKPDAPDDVKFRYAFGLLSPDDQQQAEDALETLGRGSSAGDGEQQFAFDGFGGYTIGDGYWAMAMDTGTGIADVESVLKEVVANGLAFDDPFPTMTPSPVGTPDSTSSGETVPPATAAPKPAQLFDGDCSSIYTEAEVSALTGKPMELAGGGSATSEFGGQLKFAVEQSGGVDCYWSVKGDTFSSSSPQLQFIAVPATVAKPIAKELTCGPGYSEAMTGPNVCGIEHEVDGIRVSGAVVGASTAKAKSFAASVIARLDERSAASNFAASKPVGGAWHNPVDCDALAEKINTEAVFGPGGEFGEDGLGHGSYGPPVGREITSGYETLTCSGSTPGTDGDSATSKSYRFGVMGGGAWVRDELPKASALTVPGIGDAYKVDNVLYVFTGPNLITLSYFDGTDYGDFADAAPQLRAVVTALNGM